MEEDIQMKTNGVLDILRSEGVTEGVDVISSLLGRRNFPRD
jgi:hypothetical protein